MAYEVSCDHCGARFALSDDLYARKVKGSIATIRCRRCGQDVVVDDTNQQGRSANLKPRGDSIRSTEPISERGIVEAPAPETPRVRVEALSAAETARVRPAPPPVPRKAGERRAKTLWVVSYSENDDRELTALQIRSALVRGEIDRDTIVWQEGMPEWLPMWKIPELAALLPKPGEVLVHKLPGDRSPRRPSSRPPPKPDIPPLRPLPIPGVRKELSRSRPKPPLPKRAEPESIPAIPAEDEPAPSSGVPALRALTHKDAQRKQPSADDFFLGLQNADPGLMIPPSIDVSSITSGANHASLLSAPPDDEKTLVYEPSKSTRRSREPAIVPAEAPSPPGAAPQLGDTDITASELEPKRQRAALPWMAALTLLLVAGFWLLFRSPWALQRKAESEKHAAVPAAEPAPAQPSGPTPAPEAVSANAPVQQASAPAATASSAREKPVTPQEQKGQPSLTPTVAATVPSKPKSEASKPPASKPDVTAKPEMAKPAETKPAQPAQDESTPRPPFDPAAARASLGAAAGGASACRQPGDPSGIAIVVVTFAPSGRVTSATVSGPPFAGTATGGCVARAIRGAKVPPFSGNLVTVSKSVVIQ